MPSQLIDPTRLLDGEKYHTREAASDMGTRRLLPMVKETYIDPDTGALLTVLTDAISIEVLWDKRVGDIGPFETRGDTLAWLASQNIDPMSPLEASMPWDA